MNDTQQTMGQIQWRWQLTNAWSVCRVPAKILLRDRCSSRAVYDRALWRYCGTRRDESLPRRWIGGSWHNYISSRASTQLQRSIVCAIALPGQGLKLIAHTKLSWFGWIRDSSWWRSPHVRSAFAHTPSLQSTPLASPSTARDDVLARVYY